ncbi:MAG: LuxR C-terminal-related transcriptional regulator [Bacteroidota bacterium]
MSPEVAEKLASELGLKNSVTPHESLSDRELDVYRLLAEGNSISAIADKLSLNVTTKSTYRARILTKMNMQTNTELIRYALENNLWE